MDRLERLFTLVKIAIFIQNNRKCLISDIESNFIINLKTLYYNLNVWAKLDYIKKEEIQDPVSKVAYYVVHSTQKLANLIGELTKELNT